MSIEAMIAVRDRSEVKNGERLVMLALSDYANEHGLAWPSVATLTHWTRLGERAVQGALASLVDAGELKRAGQTKSGTMIYQLTPGGEPVRSQMPPMRKKAAPDVAYRGAESAGGANSAGVQILREGGAESAPNPLINPQTNNLSSNAGASEDKKLPGTGKSETPKRQKHTGYQGSLGVWAEAFYEKTGRAPVFAQVASAAKKAREIAVALGPDLFLSAIDYYFSSSADPWYAENGYPWQIFVSQVNTLAKKAQEHGKYSGDTSASGSGAGRSNERAAKGTDGAAASGSGPETGGGSSSGGRSKYAQATD